MRGKIARGAVLLAAFLALALAAFKAVIYFSDDEACLRKRDVLIKEVRKEDSLYIKFKSEYSRSTFSDSDSIQITSRSMLKNVMSIVKSRQDSILKIELFHKSRRDSLFREYRLIGKSCPSAVQRHYQKSKYYNPIKESE